MEELLASPIAIRAALVAPALQATPRGARLLATLQAKAARADFEIAQTTDKELASVSDTDTPQGIVAIAELPERSFGNVDRSGLVLILDGVQDPGNAGTIIRTAHAFGVAATVALPGSVDLWNPKVVRSAMGALFNQVAFHAELEPVMGFLREHDIPIWVTGTAGEPVGRWSGGAGLAIVVGNEANGVSRELADAAARTVTIPVRGVESLNVAVATGIILYALTSV